MNRITDFGAVSRASVTVLVDNRADMIVRSTDDVVYFTDKPLLAEHGFAALVDLEDVGIRILWDAGGTRVTLMENVGRMEVDLGTVETIVLSHGHWDHIGAIAEVLETMARRPGPQEWPPSMSPDEVEAWVKTQCVSIVLHPAALRERWSIGKDGKRFGPVAPPPTGLWEALGAEIVCSEGAYRLAGGAGPRVMCRAAALSIPDGRPARTIATATGWCGTILRTIRRWFSTLRAKALWWSPGVRTRAS